MNPFSGMVGLVASIIPDFRGLCLFSVAQSLMGLRCFVGGVGSLS